MTMDVREWSPKKDITSIFYDLPIEDVAEVLGEEYDKKYEMPPQIKEGGDLDAFFEDILRRRVDAKLRDELTLLNSKYATLKERTTTLLQRKKELLGIEKPDEGERAAIHIVEEVEASLVSEIKSVSSTAAKALKDGAKRVKEEENKISINRIRDIIEKIDLLIKRADSLIEKIEIKMGKEEAIIDDITDTEEVVSAMPINPKADKRRVTSGDEGVVTDAMLVEEFNGEREREENRPPPAQPETINMEEDTHSSPQDEIDAAFHEATSEEIFMPMAP